MAVVKANGIGKVYPEGTTYLEIARDFQDQYVQARPAKSKAVP